MKKVIIVLMFLSSFCYVFSQQNTTSPTENQRIRVDKIIERLDGIVVLKPEQKEKIRQYANQFVVQRDSLRKQLQSNKQVQKLKQDIQILRQNFKKQIRDILTSEQIERLREMNKQRRENRNKNLRQTEKNDALDKVLPENE
ncbi:MAG: hypothetical protein RMJ53_05890 [Chitinophagales bacterium]|nr:hypothetical protein [Chitinophagales bacterium]MDW8273742.1 hypothetical protein [Chitinophagales bacterium]